ncbi:glycosyltransferase [Schaalia canis]|uniref:Glycosyltransferase n=1 Tax=Schaalia canis TaxID=100469 RepID=A0A3P1SEN7_9ACTO|nr:glycosyltransferase [Schaalia canis]RRC95479.1 glycosyltransferase [Schaalia canis]
MIAEGALQTRHDQGRRPRVLYVTAWLPTPASLTTGIFVERDIRALTRIADIHVIHLLAPHLAAKAHLHETWQEAGQTITVERVLTTPSHPLSLLSAGRRIRRRFAQVDLLHTATPPALLALGATHVPIPWVHTDHWSGYADVPLPVRLGENLPAEFSPAQEASSPSVGKRLTLRMLGSMMRRVDVLVGVSATLSAQMAHLSAREVTTVPNIVDMALCEPRPHTDPWAHTRPLRIISVANAVEGKRPLLAVAACAELIARGRPVELTWVGEGPLLPSMRASAERAGVPIYTPGACPPTQVRELLADSDLFLLPTAWETFCLAAAEALSAGRPVVMGDQGGQRAFVHPPSGVLVSGEDPASYADAVEAVLRATAGLSAAEIGQDIRQRYSPEAFTECYNQIYSPLLSR